MGWDGEARRWRGGEGGLELKAPRGEGCICVSVQVRQGWGWESRHLKMLEAQLVENDGG